jgi:hypothetical protein
MPLESHQCYSSTPQLALLRGDRAKYTCIPQARSIYILVGIVCATREKPWTRPASFDKTRDCWPMVSWGRGSWVRSDLCRVALITSPTEGLATCPVDNDSSPTCTRACASHEATSPNIAFYDNSSWQKRRSISKRRKQTMMMRKYHVLSPYRCTIKMDQWNS